ncbi:MAG: hypothetical protein MK085_05965 [Phycisphaerales bacterium]|nr:hypothetical protein [Phycisphaerales bacterium]
MRVPLFIHSACLASVIAVTSHAELVDTFTIGEGDTTAHIQFDFIVGHTYLYEIRWDGTSMTGRDVFDMIKTAQPDDFDFTYISYTFGDFLTSVTIGQDHDAGEGTTPPDYINYWHYWNRTDGESWQNAMSGFSDRILEDGSWDGWVFGVVDAPQEIPSPGVFGLAGIAALVARGQRRRI